jgi:hypothetical protein
MPELLRIKSHIEVSPQKFMITRRKGSVKSKTHDFHGFIKIRSLAKVFPCHGFTQILADFERKNT